MSKRPTTRIDPEAVKSAAGTSKISAIAKMVGLSPSNTAKILENAKCSDRSAAKISSGLGIPITELCVRDKRSVIPKDIRWIESLRHGYFLDQLRNGSGELVWLYEAVSLAHKNVSGSALIHFEGRLTPITGTGFDIEVTRLNDFLLSITAKDDSNSESFTGAFTLRDRNILSGIWIGVPASTSADAAVFRLVFSQKRLSRNRLRELSSEHKVVSSLEGRFSGKIVDHLAE